MNRYVMTIGLEIHVEMNTKTKIFCGCSTAFGAKPNTQTCPVCMGMPGALPVLNRQVVQATMAVGLACNCSITRRTVFDRKNYFYPDNPQNYQISQLYAPICTNGQIETSLGMVGIHEIHMEEDAAKLIHDEATGQTMVDYNRSGVPLMEIVTEPNMHSSKEVQEFLQEIISRIRYLKVSDCRLNEGSMRVDVNLSVAEPGQLGTRTEMKNLNSFKAITRAIEQEASRQMEILERGEAISMETRRWDDTKGCSYVMRSKEDARDYRYFPEPDLYPLQISEEWIMKLRQQQPEFQQEKICRFCHQYQLPEYDAQILTVTREMADFYEAAVAAVQDCKQQVKYAKKISNWLMGETMRLQNQQGLSQEQIPFSPHHLVCLLEMIEKGQITQNTGKEIFQEMFLQDMDPVTYAKEQHLMIEEDTEKLQQLVEQVIADNPKSVMDYQGGKKQAMGYLTGCVMKCSGGKANPKLVQEILTKLL